MYPRLVLAQLRKTRLCLTERLLMGRKKSNQTKQTNTKGIKSGLFYFNCFVDVCILRLFPTIPRVCACDMSWSYYFTFRYK